MRLPTYLLLMGVPLLLSAPSTLTLVTVVFVLPLVAIHLAPRFPTSLGTLGTFLSAAFFVSGLLYGFAH